MKDQNKVYDFSLTEVLKFALKWKWHIIILTVLAGIAAAIFSGPNFITPKFESVVVFYPTTNNSISNAILSDNTLKDKDALEFGEESEAEYALQILNSAPLMNRVVQHFDLMKHYGIDPNGSYPQTELGREINSNFTFKRTELLSIEIKVLDRDPQMAADIANYISAVLDTAKTEVQRQVARKTFSIIQQEYEAKIKEVESLQEQINELTSDGAAIQTNPFSRGNKRKARTDALQGSGEMANAKNLGTLLKLTETLSLQNEQLQELKKKFERAKVDLEEFIPHHFVISPAVPAEKKAKPIRWIIVAVSVISTFLLSIILIILFERLRSSFRQISSENRAA